MKVKKRKTNILIQKYFWKKILFFVWVFGKSLILYAGLSNCVQNNRKFN